MDGFLHNLGIGKARYDSKFVTVKYKMDELGRPVVGTLEEAVHGTGDHDHSPLHRVAVPPISNFWLFGVTQLPLFLLLHPSSLLGSPSRRHAFLQCPQCYLAARARV